MPWWDDDPRRRALAESNTIFGHVEVYRAKGLDVAARIGGRSSAPLPTITVGYDSLSLPGCFRDEQRHRP
jgi:hypothetical protein